MLDGPDYQQRALHDARTGEVLVARVATARTRRARQKGLLGIDTLPAGHGLLLGEPLVHMAGMRFALDLVFITRRGRIVKVCERVNPGPRLRGSVRARWCLELPAGAAAAAGLHAGLGVSFAEIS